MICLSYKKTCPTLLSFDSLVLSFEQWSQSNNKELSNVLTSSGYNCLQIGLDQPTQEFDSVPVQVEWFHYSVVKPLYCKHSVRNVTYQPHTAIISSNSTEVCLCSSSFFSFSLISINYIYIYLFSACASFIIIPSIALNYVNSR